MYSTLIGFLKTLGQFMHLFIKHFYANKILGLSSNYHKTHNVIIKLRYQSCRHSRIRDELMRMIPHILKQYHEYSAYVLNKNIKAIFLIKNIKIHNSMNDIFLTHFQLLLIMDICLRKLANSFLCLYKHLLLFESL